MKAYVKDFKLLLHRSAAFLLAYRNTPHTTTNRTPAEMFVGRQLRTRLDLMRPAVDEGVRSQQAQQKAAHDQHCSNREFHIGQQVMARNFRQGPLWHRGIFSERLGPLTYLVEMDEDRSWKCHVDQLRVHGD